MTYARIEGRHFVGLLRQDRPACAIRLFLSAFLSQRFVEALRFPDGAQRSKRATVSFADDFNLT